MSVQGKGAGTKERPPKGKLGGRLKSGSRILVTHEWERDGQGRKKRGEEGHGKINPECRGGIMRWWGGFVDFHQYKVVNVRAATCERGKI